MRGTMILDIATRLWGCKKKTDIAPRTGIRDGKNKFYFSNIEWLKNVNSGEGEKKGIVVEEGRRDTLVIETVNSFQTITIETCLNGDNDESHINRSEIWHLRGSGHEHMRGHTHGKLGGHIRNWHINKLLEPPFSSFPRDILLLPQLKYDLILAFTGLKVFCKRLMRLYCSFIAAKSITRERCNFRKKELVAEECLEEIIEEKTTKNDCCQSALSNYEKIPNYSIIKSINIKENWDTTNYKFLKSIGTGTYGKVMLTMEISSKKLFACKVVNGNRIVRKLWWIESSAHESNAHKRNVINTSPSSTSFPLSTQNSNDKEVLEREILILSLLKEKFHVNINRVIDLVYSRHFLTLYAVFELCEYGAIMTFDYNGNSSFRYSEHLVKVYTFDIANGLTFLHENYIVHYDIKPENILLKHSLIKLDKYLIDRTRTGIAQITDFGSAEVYTQSTFSSPKKISSWKLSPLFTPPEIIFNPNPVLSAPPIDIWALGVTIYCLSHGSSPWSAVVTSNHCFTSSPSHLEIFTRIINSEITFSPFLSKELIHFLFTILNREPFLRPSISSVRSHPWINNFSSSV